MLFKWNAQISLEPDLDEMMDLCKENRDRSFLMKPFFEIVKDMSGVDLKELDASHQDSSNNKNNFIQYLTQEVGQEIDIAWKTKFFFMTATIKTDDIGYIINILNKASLLN